MTNNHILTSGREDSVATVTLNRADAHDAVIADFPMTVIGKVTQRMPCQQVAEEAALRGDPA